MAPAWSTARPCDRSSTCARSSATGCWAAPPRFPADLYLVEWLDHQGIDVDVLTDHDLHAEGADLLRPYAVVLSSTHHEYWTAGCSTGSQTYLDGGGRFMYLGGNSLFGVASVDPDRPHRTSRSGGGGAAGRSRWRRRSGTTPRPASRAGRGATAAAARTAGRARDRPAPGSIAASPYMRQPDSYDPRVGFIFEGIDGELIGDQPNLQTRWGAAGYEFDRFEPSWGRRRRRCSWRRRCGFNASHRPMVDEELYFTQGRDGAAGDPQVHGEPHRFVRSDMAYLEYPNGGAVFSAGSICWGGACRPTTTATRCRGSRRTSCAGSPIRPGDGPRRDAVSRSSTRRRSGRPIPTIPPAMPASRGSRGSRPVRSCSATGSARRGRATMGGHAWSGATTAGIPGECWAGRSRARCQVAGTSVAAR